jgi:hypothetical protein
MLPSPGMNGAVRRVSDYVTRHPWQAIALFAAVYGFRTTDVAEFRAISAGPFQLNLLPEFQFLYGSPFTFFVGSYYQHHGLDHVTAFFVVYSLGIVFFFASLRRVLVHQFGDEGHRLAMIVMLSSPLLLIVLSFVGKSDTYLLAFLFLLMTTDSAATEVMLSALIILCHREMGAAALCTYLCVKGGQWRTIGLGLVFGEALLGLYTQGLMSAPPQLRVTYFLQHAADLWRIFLEHPFVHVAASFGPFWIYVVSRKRLTPAAVVAFFAALALSIGVYDFTRVFIVLSAPLLLDVTREVLDDVRHHGGIALGGYRLSVHALWPLMFIQGQVAGGKLLWAQGIDFVLGS